MYVLGIRVKLQLAAFNVLKYFFQTLYDSLALAFFNDAAFAQHRRVRDRARDVLPVHSRIKLYRRVEVIDPLIDLFCKSSCPHLLSHTETTFAGFNASCFDTVCRKADTFSCFLPLISCF